MEEVKVTSVKREGHIFCAPPVEPLSGYIRPIPEQELLRRVIKCTPRSSLIADQQLLEAFANLPDGKHINVAIQLKQGASPEKMAEALEWIGKIPPAISGDEVYTSVGFTGFIRLCAMQDVKGLVQKVAPAVEKPDTIPS